MEDWCNGALSNAMFARFNRGNVAGQSPLSEVIVCATLRYVKHAASYLSGI